MSYAQSKAGGKVVQVSLEYDGVIRSITITGDFFIHPEEGIKHIEQALTGKKLEDVEQVLRVVTQEMELVGITTKVLEELIHVASTSTE